MTLSITALTGSILVDFSFLLSRSEFNASTVLASAFTAANFLSYSSLSEFSRSRKANSIRRLVVSEHLIPP